MRDAILLAFAFAWDISMCRTPSHQSDWFTGCGVKRMAWYDYIATITLICLFPAILAGTCLIMFLIWVLTMFSE